MYRNFRDIYKYGYSDIEFWEEIKQLLDYNVDYRRRDPSEARPEDVMNGIRDAVNELSMEQHHPFYHIKKSDTGIITELMCEYVGDAYVRAELCPLVTVAPKIGYNVSNKHNGVIAVFGKRCRLLLHRYYVQTIGDKVGGCTYWINSPLKIFAAQMKVDLFSNYDKKVDLSEHAFINPYRNFIQSKPDIEGTVEYLDSIKEMIFELSDMVDEVKTQLMLHEQCTTEKENN